MRWSGTALGLVATIATLIIVGLVFVLSASSSLSLRQHGNPYWIFIRQIMWVGLGAVAMVITASIDHRQWERLRFPLLFVSLIALLLVLTPLGLARNGSRRWIGPSSIAVQPSEFAKLGLAIFSASLLSRLSHRVDDWRRVLRPCLVWLGAMVLPVLLQPDMGTSFVFVAIALSLLWTAQVPLRQLSATALGMAVLGVWYARSADYRWDRVTSFLDKSDVDGLGYHLHQSLIGLGSGRVTGLGVGASRAKWGFLPNAHTDFIFSVIGEELGLVGAVLVVALFCAVAVLGVQASRRAPDQFGSLLANGITTWVIAQALANIGAVLGLVPITGIPLPFLSVGGSSLVVMMGAVGILVRIARFGDDGRRGSLRLVGRSTEDQATAPGPRR